MQTSSTKFSLWLKDSKKYDSEWNMTSVFETIELAESRVEYLRKLNSLHLKNKDFKIVKEIHITKIEIVYDSSTPILAQTKTQNRILTI